MQVQQKLIVNPRLFWLALIVKLLAGILFASYLVRDWFVPFVDYFVVSGFANPWEHFLSIGQLKAFPYGTIMLYILTVGKIIVLPLEMLFGGSIFLDLFGFTLVSLAADFLVYVILCKLLKEHTHKVFYLYFCSPIVFYITYFHRQLDIIPISLLMVSLWWLLRKKYHLSALMLGLAINAKFSVLIALPFVFLYLFRKQKWYVAGTYLLLTIATSVVFLIPFGFSPGYDQMVFKNSEQNWVFDLLINYQNHGLALIIMPTLLGVLFLSYASYSKLSREALLMYIGLAFMMLVTFISPMPGWYLWSYPFIVYSFISYHDFPRFPLVSLTLSYLAYFTFYSQSTFIDSFGAIFPEYQKMAMPVGAHAFAGDKLDSLLFIPLVSSMLYLMVIMYRQGIKSNQLLNFRQRPCLIGIGGDSGTGKHTVSRLITQVFGNNKSLEINGDADHKWERGDENWTQYTHLDPKANKLHQQLFHMRMLKHGRSIVRSEYDHRNGKFTPGRSVHPYDYLIFVGLHPYFIPKMRELFDLKIFMLQNEDLRRYWKVRRDQQRRGYTETSVIAQIERRLPDSQRYITPQADYADLLISYQKTDSDGDDLQADYTLSTSWDLDPIIDYFGSIEQQGFRFFHHYDEEFDKQKISVSGAFPEHVLSDYTISRSADSFEDYIVNDFKFESGVNGFTQFLVLYLINYQKLENHVWKN